ncbi:hypothetical protein UQW22_13535 [Isoptericola halotolerans]|uniref:hypothetical protein n=1 Tax=Isoptericola halotolerans TaxID=300560 RepID=UPI00388E5115
MADTPRPLTPLNGFLLGVGAAVVGLIPWVLTGMVLPLQNLWGSATLPEDMPVALLPFSQYFLMPMFGILVLPGAALGVVLRRGARTRQAARRSTLAATAGLVVVQGGAAAQTIAVVAGGLRPGAESFVYLAAISAAILAFLGTSVSVCRELASGSVPTATIAAALGALGAGYWWDAFLSVHPAWMLDLPAATVRLIFLGGALLPAVLTGVALAWCGWAPRRRLGAWAAAVLVLWVGGAAFQALVASVSSRALLGDPQAMVDLAVGGLGRGFVADVPTAAVAVMVGVGGMVAPSVSRFYRARAGATPRA